MIITQNLCWHHLPKTAGTTTDRLFLASGLPLLLRDSQDSYVKHLPSCDHPLSASLPITGKKCVTNFRRLPHWLLSNYQHKIKRMNLDLSVYPLKDGLFWRHKEQSWLPADWWIDRFCIDQSWILLRCENLKSDFLSCLSLYESIGFRSSLNVRFVKSRNRTDYKRSLNYWFTANDLRKMYTSNPRWANLERLLYGQLLTDLD